MLDHQQLSTNMKKIYVILLVGAVALSWFSLVNRSIVAPQQFEAGVAKAQEAYDQGYYLEAQNILTKTESESDIENTYAADALQRDIYLGLEDSDQYALQLQSMIQKYPDVAENYEKYATYLYDSDFTSQLIDTLNEYNLIFPDSEVLHTLTDNLDKSYEYVRIGYYDVKYASRSILDIQEMEFESMDTGEVDAEGNQIFENVVFRNLFNATGNKIFETNYSEIALSQDGSRCFIKIDGEPWKSINGAGNLLAHNDDVSFDKIYPLAANGIAVAVINGETHFINDHMRVSSLVWEDARGFDGNIGAVKKGGKWAIVNGQNWENVEEFPYTDVPANSLGCCAADGVCAVADNTGYYVIETEKLSAVSDKTYEELKAFECSQPTAYRKGNLWGFVNRHGEVYIEAQYEDAKPFYNGYAAVKKDGLWGYINSSGTMIIEPQFQDALNILPNGRAYVQNELGYWDYVEIARLKYSS